MRAQIWVGCKSGDYAVFRNASIPTEQSHGHLFAAVIGPFRTMRAAQFMASPAARNNPHVQTVADAERIAGSH